MFLPHCQFMFHYHNDDISHMRQLSWPTSAPVEFLFISLNVRGDCCSIRRSSETLTSRRTPPLVLSWYVLDGQVEHSCRLHFTALAQICFNHLSRGWAAGVQLQRWSEAGPERERRSPQEDRFYPFMNKTFFFFFFLQPSKERHFVIQGEHDFFGLCQGGGAVQFDFSIRYDHFQTIENK